MDLFITINPRTVCPGFNQISENIIIIVIRFTSLELLPHILLNVDSTSSVKADY